MIVGACCNGCVLWAALIQLHAAMIVLHAVMLNCNTALQAAILILHCVIVVHASLLYCMQIVAVRHCL